MTTSTCRTPSARKRGEVLLGLRHPALGGGDDEHHRGHRAHAGEHVRDEPLVARHVDEGELPPVDVGPREAEVDGQPAALLLGQPVGPHAGEPLHERRLAVVDVAGGGYDIHASTARTERLVVLRRDRAQVEQAAAALQAADDRRRAGAQRRGVGLGQADGGAGQLDAGRPAAADGRDAVDRLRAGQPFGEPFRPGPQLGRRRRRAPARPAAAGRRAWPPARPA